MKKSWTVLAASAVAFTAVSIAAHAAQIDLPARKPGLWQMKLTPKTAGAAPQMTTQLCLDAATDKALMAKGMAMSPTCAMQQSRDSNGNIVFDATCDLGGRKTKTHGVISGDFQSHYSLVIVSDSEGGNPALPKHTELTQEATWIGACTAGMKPGDMVMPGGRTINLLGMMKPQG